MDDIVYPRAHWGIFYMYIISIASGSQGSMGKYDALNG